MEEDVLDVIIIGSGWAGVCTMKHCLDEHITAVVLEKNSDYGGVWNINNSPAVYANTYSVTSKHYLSMSDFPMPDSYPEFPHHSLVMDYMRMYVAHFNVDKHIRFNSEVVKIEKRKNLWHVQYIANSRRITLMATNIALCTGQNSICRNYPDIDTSLFQGKIIHAADYDESVKNECLNKRVLIYGGSDTAFDIAVELANNMYNKRKGSNGKTQFGFVGPNNTLSDQKTMIYVSMRKGRWIQRRTGGAYEPADMFYNRFTDNFLKNTDKSLINYIFIGDLNFWWGKSGSGIPEWETDAGYLNSYYIKSADILPKVTFGEVIPLEDITSVGKTSVVIADNKTYDIDIIIMATGYKGMSCYTFIPEFIKSGDYYDHIFHCNDPSIAKVGFIRPYLTSIPMIIEMQSRYVAKVFAKKILLPSTDEMKEQYAIMKQKQSIEFNYDYERVSGIIDPYDYMNMVASKIGAAPNLMILLFKDPILLYYIIFNTWSHFVFRLNDPDPEKRKIAHEQIVDLKNHEASNKIKGSSLKFVFLIVLAIITIWLLYRNKDFLYKTMNSKYIRKVVGLK
jgi:dimethylaniline monooxygenase (N-oxide forming)